MVQKTEFGFEIAHRLVDLGMTKAELCREVQRRTGLTFDGWYLHRIMTGAAKPKKQCDAIREILSLPTE